MEWEEFDMRRYFDPEMDITLFDADSVLTASGYNTPTNNSLPDLHSDQSQSENPTFITTQQFSALW